MAVTTIAYGPDQTGLTGLYAVLRDTTGRPFNTNLAVYETYNASHWTDYDVALAEQGATGMYLASVPAAAQSALGFSVIHQRAGGSPAVSDISLGAETFPVTGVSSGLSEEEREALERIAARVNTHGGTETRATDGTVTNISPLPLTGGTMTAVTNAAKTTLTVTVED